MDESLINYVVDANSDLVDAVKKLNKNINKGLIIVEEDKVIGVFTRRDLVKSMHCFGMEEKKIKTVLNKSFDYFINVVDEEIVNVSKHALIPLLNEKHQLLDIIFPPKSNSDLKYKYPVVIMAGGLGTRLYPYTKVLPKPLVPVNGVPMVEIIMNEFIKYGSKDFYLIVNHKKEMIQAYFDNLEKDFNVYYGIEHKQLGTGGGLFYIKNSINETFFLTNCDTLLLQNYNEIFEYHKESKSLVTMLVSVKCIDIPYGVIEVGKSREIVNMTEKPSYGVLVNTGMYVVNKEVFNFIDEGEAISFPDIIERIKNAGEKVSVYPITDDSWIDMGEVKLFEEAKEVLKQKG